MNNTAKTLIIIAVAGGVSYLIYRKYFGEPKVELERVNWDTSEADVTVNGKSYTITKDQALSLNNGYSVAFGDAYRPDLNRIGSARLEVQVNGASHRILAYYK